MFLRHTFIDPVPSDPCTPSPCGPNTRCRVMNGAAICECIPGYEGSPTTSGCRPECVISPDCPRNRACVNNKCVDPCPGVCGYEAVCQTINHSPVCSCPPPTIGDPFVECKKQKQPPSKYFNLNFKCTYKAMFKFYYTAYCVSHTYIIY